MIVIGLSAYFPALAAAGGITGTVKVKGLRSPGNVLVYLAEAPAADLNLEKVRFEMDQRNLTFLPHLLPVPVGATISFPNHDKVDHNVFSLSRANPFNLGSYKPGEVKTVRFEKPGIVELRCDVHAEMQAYIMVMKNPYYAVTDEKGRFEFPAAVVSESSGIGPVPNLPPGNYLIKTWHEKLKTKKQKVSITGDDTISVQLTLTRGTPSVLYK